MDLNECLRKNLIKRTNVDEDLIHSLIEMSDIKQEVVENSNINERNISVFVSLAYDSLREVLEALCIKNGYKVISHICIGELLKTLLDDFDYETFDRLRWIRNSINYYGEKVEYVQGIKIIKKIFEMKKKILEEYLK